MKKILIAAITALTLTSMAYADSTIEQNEIMTEYLKYAQDHNYPGGRDMAIVDLLSNKPEAIAIYKEIAHKYLDTHQETDK